MFGLRLSTAVAAAASALLVNGQCSCPPVSSLCTAPGESWGQLSWYNLAALGDLTVGAADVEGPVAAGNVFRVATAGQGGIGHMIYCEPNEISNTCQARLNNVAPSVALGDKTCTSLAEDSKNVNGLTVGGSFVNYNSGVVHMGNILTTSSAAASASLEGRLPANTGCTVEKYDGLPEYFRSLANKASELSAHYTSLPTTRTPWAVNSGYLQITPTATRDKEVVEIPADKFNSARWLTFMKDPNTQTGEIIIRVRGPTIRVPAAANNQRVHGMASRLVFVFPDAETVSLNVAGVGDPQVGHILAPKATVTKSGAGIVIGRVVAQNINITTQVNWLVDNRAPICENKEMTCQHWL